ncbi:MAG: outer membrane beta-barrel protein [Nitrospiraceae bacterium]
MSARSRIGIGIGMCAMVSLLGSNVAMAAHMEGHAAAHIEKESVWQSLGFKISGAVEASYTQNFNNPNTNLNQLRIFDTQANSFVPQVAQLVFERPATAGSAMDRVGFRARLNFGAQSRFSRARTNFQPGTDNNEVDFQELYAEYIAPIGNGLKIQAGKINTLIGYEGINSWENPNFSRSFMFGLSQAFTTTGIRFTYPLASWGTVAVGLVNGWDNIEDNNRGKTVEWKVDLVPHEKFGIAFFGSYGAEQSNGNAIFGNAATGVCVSGTTGCDPTAKRMVVGSIITIKPTSMDTLILEPYYGNESNATTNPAVPSGNARWNGLIAYLIHDFNDQQQPNAFSLRIRGEVWEDNGGVRSCVGGNNFNGGTNVCAGPAAAGGFLPPVGTGGFNNATGIGQRQTLWEGTFTLQYKPAPSLITRAEFRYDKSDQNVFLRGHEAINNQQTMAFSVVYLF